MAYTANEKRQIKDAIRKRVQELRGKIWDCHLAKDRGVSEYNKELSGVINELWLYGFTIEAVKGGENPIRGMDCIVHSRRNADWKAICNTFKWLRRFAG